MTHTRYLPFLWAHFKRWKDNLHLTDLFWVYNETKYVASIDQGPTYNKHSLNSSLKSKEPFLYMLCSMKQTRQENPRHLQLNSYLDAVSPQLHFSFPSLGQMMHLCPQQLLCQSTFVSTLLWPLLLFQQPTTIYHVETKTNQVRTSQRDILELWL